MMTENAEFPGRHHSVLVANTGIQLQALAGQFLVHPKEPTGWLADSFVPFTLPRIESLLVERTAGTARAFWRRHGRSLTFLPYLDLRNRCWRICIPPQLACLSDGRIDCRFAGLAPPEEEWRLAGSLRSLPTIRPDDAVFAVPPLDGIHLIMDPAKPWVSVYAFLCVSQVVVRVPADYVIADQDEDRVSTVLPLVAWADDL